MKRATVALLAALSLAGCAGEATPKGGPPVVVENHGYVDAQGCWGDVTAGGQRLGPYACAGDGVTPLREHPVSR